jgi:hypothetical protein
MVSRHQRIIVLEATDKNENIGYLNHTSRAVVEIKVEREEREKANKPPSSQTKSKKKNTRCVFVPIAFSIFASCQNSIQKKKDRWPARLLIQIIRVPLDKNETDVC